MWPPLEYTYIPVTFFARLYVHSLLQS